MITKLQLGAGRLANLKPEFLDKSWMHFGVESKFKHKLVYFFTRRKNSKLTNFQDFYYREGDRLPFEDDTLNFIFSEHFFEHLLFGEALALFKECYRILKPGGVIRTCVPDADLRTYEPPEPEGYPDPKLSGNHPDRHKTRWSVYLLSDALKQAGFKKIVPLVYCDKFGNFHQVYPRNGYKDLSYIQRKKSLIIDGIKV